MFDPIKASKEIKDSYIDYITTTFDMADTDYEREFRKELQTDGMVASGPFLDIGGSYETGHTLRELIQAQKASVLFENHNHRNRLLYLLMEKNCFSTITGKKFGVFYAIRKNLEKNF